MQAASGIILNSKVQATEEEYDPDDVDSLQRKSRDMLLVEFLYLHRGPDNSSLQEFIKMFQNPKLEVRDNCIDRKVAAFLEMVGLFYADVAALVEKTSPDEVCRIMCFCTGLSACMDNMGTGPGV